MYLTDSELFRRLTEFHFTSEAPDEPFDPDAQIGPCSVDLRLSPSFWTPRGRRLPPFWRRPVTDLANTHVRELNPTLGWDSRVIHLGDHITLKPGQMILGRTMEAFSMPHDCAGAIEGRSSFSRLGLSVHTDGGFINPGWRGQMPLTLYNQSPTVLRIPVGTPLCQLLVIPLDPAPERDYGQRSDRKYMNDYGGPSVWWRDDQMRQIRDRMGKIRLDTSAFDELDRLLHETPDDQTFVRLETYIARRGSRRYGNAVELLDSFAKSESRRQWGQRALLGCSYPTLVIAVTFLLTLLTLDAAAYLWWLAAILTSVSSVWALWALTTRVPYHLTRDELSRLRQAHAGTAPVGPAPPHQGHVEGTTDQESSQDNDRH